MPINLLLVSRKQFHLASDWRRFAVKQFIESSFEESIRWVLFDLNPDIVGFREIKTSWALQQSNSFHYESLRFIDGVILAEPEEWTGRSLEVLYHLVSAHKKPLILLFPKVRANLLTPLEKKVFGAKDTFVLVEDEVTLNFFKNLGSQAQVVSKPWQPLYLIKKEGKLGVFFEIDDPKATRQLLKEAQKKVTHFFPATLREFAYLSELGLENITYNEDPFLLLKAMSHCQALFSRNSLIDEFANVHGIQVLKSLDEPFCPPPPMEEPRNEISEKVLSAFSERVKHAP